MLAYIIYKIYTIRIFNIINFSFFKGHARSIRDTDSFYVHVIIVIKGYFWLAAYLTFYLMNRIKQNVPERVVRM